MTGKVIVEPFNPDWIHQFSELKNLIWPAVKDIALSIEHIGSTSVPGLAAKPVIDLDIIIPEISHLDEISIRLAPLGYKHLGNLGIQDREVFRPHQPLYKHNLYVCPKESIGLRNHLCLRDSLRADPNLRDEYASLKIQLAAKFPDSIDNYVEGKTEFILKILKLHGLGPDNLDSIRKANLAPTKDRKF